MNQYKLNNYDEVINDIGTYKVIAGNLKRGFSTFIGWTDNDSTHYDILFTYGCTGEGCYSRKRHHRRTNNDRYKRLR